MSANIFSIGLSALSAAQIAQKTTSHNLANQKTEGYNRQIVSQSSAGAINTGSGYVGMGTEVTDISRAFNNLLNVQVMGAKSASSAYDSYLQKITQLDDIVADKKAGLSPVLQEFFKSWHNLSSDTNIAGSRQSVISNTETMVARMNALGDVMQESLRTVNGEVTTSVGTINSYSARIAQLNEQITGAFSSGTKPNDLLDQRDQAIAELNKIVKVTTLRQDDHSLSVFIGSGQPLVMGNDRAVLKAIPNPTDPTQTQVAYKFKNSSEITIADKLLTGGSLGGLLQYRSETLLPAMNALGRVAISMAQEFNNQHELGIDQNGNPGKPLFKVGDPAVFGHSGNSASSFVTAEITDSSKLTASDYRLDYDGTNYTVTRLSDRNKTTYAGADFPVTIDGIEIKAPTMNAGEGFTIKPTANGATTLRQMIFDPKEIAAATPIVTSSQTIPNFGLDTSSNTGSGRIISPTLSNSFAPGTTLNFSYSGGNMTLSPGAEVRVLGTDGVTTTYPSGTAFPWAEGATVTSGGMSFIMGGTPNNGDHFNFSPVRANLGTATISAGTIDKSYLTSPLPANAKLEFSYDGAANTLVPNASVGPIVVTHADGTTTNYAAGAAIPYKETDKLTTGGITVQFNGTPVNGDRFAIEPNKNGLGDNRNSQLLANLQTKDTLGNTTFQGAYSSMVSQVGNKTSEVKVLGGAEKARLDALVVQQQSEQGVNQDEELANIIANQFAYQAATKIIKAGSDMFDAILAIR